VSITFLGIGWTPSNADVIEAAADLGPKTKNASFWLKTALDRGKPSL